MLVQRGRVTQTPQYISIGNEDRPEPGPNGHRSVANLPPEDVQEVHPDDRPYGLPDLIDDIYGVENVDERFEVSRAAYESVDAAVTFTVYEGYGHTLRPAIDDLVEFHRDEMQNLDASNTVTRGCSPEVVEESNTTADPSATDTGTEAPSTTATATEESTDTAAESTGREVPGFGVGATLSAIAGAGYILKRRFEPKN